LVARMELGTVPGEGRRGFHTFAPPPQGCVGWGNTPEPTQTAKRLDTMKIGKGLQKFKSYPLNKARDEGRLNPMLGLAPPDDVKTGGSSTVRQGRQAKLGMVTSDAAARARNQSAIEDWEVEVSLGSNSTRLLAEAQLAREVNPSHLGPLKDAQHLKAVRTGEFSQLQSMDPAFKEAMEEDPTLETASGNDAALAGALRVYRSSLGVLDPAPEHKRCAFQAVMRDDAELLRALFDSGGVPWDAKNGAGQTLLEVATERKKSRCQYAIQRARDQQIAAAAKVAPRPRRPRAATEPASMDDDGKAPSSDDGRSSPRDGRTSQLDGRTSQTDGRTSQLSTSVVG